VENKTYTMQHVLKMQQVSLLLEYLKINFYSCFPTCVCECECRSL